MKKILQEKLADKFFKRCPKSGKIVGIKNNKLIFKILFPIIGLLAIIWFLIRVVPKPSRLAYPCQQPAAGIGVSFLLYLVGAIGTAAVYDQIRSKINKHLAFAYIIATVFFVSMGIMVAQDVKTPVQDLKNPDGQNNPMGEAKGIFPGRVSWTQDFKATSWDEKTRMWWDDNATNQAECDKMMSRTTQSITGTTTDWDAWKKLFEFNNKQNGHANQGYTKGEKIIIKVNMNALRNSTDEWKNQGYPSPQMVYALIAQLIAQAGVAGEDIMITDPSRFIGDQIINRIRKNPSQDFQHVMFEECEAKNHFGSVWGFEFNKFHPATLHTFALWDYPNPNKLNEPHSAPVLLGHKLLNSKTFLYLADGMYTAVNQTGPVKRMSTFNND
jgi:hypothetical protein